jgi:hypothetical protein
MPIGPQGAAIESRQHRGRLSLILKLHAPLGPQSLRLVPKCRRDRCGAL